LKNRLPYPLLLNGARLAYLPGKGKKKTALERQIAATDTQIDALVYELYRLTAEEIAIVEGTK
jgi:hypothetical protein